MVSSGIRIGAWDSLKWKHIIPIKNDNGIIIAARIIVYGGEPDEYYSFITSEAYQTLQEWMDYRQRWGEKITGESWLMRDKWEKTNRRYGHNIGSKDNPERLNSEAIRTMLKRAWKDVGIRQEINNDSAEGKSISKRIKRYEFKSTHSFRKFFKTTCEKSGMKSINIELLMGHNIGVSGSYYKPTEKEVLEDYIKHAVDYLTINEENRLSKRVQELKQKNDYQNYIIDKKIKEKDEQIEKLLNEVAEQRSTINGLDSNYLKVFTEIDKEKLEKEKLMKKLEILEARDKEHDRTDKVLLSILKKFEEWESTQQDNNTSEKSH
jgi:hypothetical protein